MNTSTLTTAVYSGCTQDKSYKTREHTYNMEDSKSLNIGECEEPQELTGILDFSGEFIPENLEKGYDYD